MSWLMKFAAVLFFDREIDFCDVIFLRGSGLRIGDIDFVRRCSELIAVFLHPLHDAAVS